VYHCYGGGEAAIMCLYVDDILIFGPGLNVIKDVKYFQQIWDEGFGVADDILNTKLLKKAMVMLQFYSPTTWKELIHWT
jgi:hypothetical protein